MALKIYSAKDIQTKPVTALVYAKAGSGKTYTLGQLSGRTVILDIDKTAHVLKDNPNVIIIDIDIYDTVNSMNEAIQWIMENKDRFDNVCVDNVSELQNCILSAYGKAGRNDGVPSQADYQKYQFKLMDYLRQLKFTGKNVILTAWEELVTITSPTGEQYTAFMPRIQKTVRDSVCGLCDVVGHFDFDEHGERFIRLQTMKNVYAKNQIDDRKACKQNELVNGGK